HRCHSCYRGEGGHTLDTEARDQTPYGHRSHCFPHPIKRMIESVLTTTSMSDIRCIGIATGGGDAPGLNAVIRSATKAAIVEHKWKVVGIPDGFDGLIWPEKSFELTLDSVSGILPRGGTILGTTNRGNPFHYKAADGDTRDISDQVIANAKQLGIDAIITIGGDGSQKIGYELF